jgi:hypothetical protein
LPPKVRGPVLREALRLLALSLRFEINGGHLIPHLIDQNPCAHWRNPIDMIFQGRSTSVFQA